VGACSAVCPPANPVPGASWAIWTASPAAPCAFHARTARPPLAATSATRSAPVPDGARRAAPAGAEAALAFAWGAFATGLLAAALARDSAGTLVLAVFCAWQLCDVWTAVRSDGPAPEATGEARGARR
jgi:hypothetical protein